MSRLDQVVEEFVDAICGLSRANRLTGIWDNRRFQECKKAFSDVDCEYLYKTEKLSRHNVELRALFRTKIDILFAELLSLRKAIATSGK